MLYAHILGTGSYLPVRRMSNDDLSKIVDTSDEWITSRTGIKARHIAAENEQTSDLAVRAARAALVDADIEAKDIDLIIVATSTPDMTFPATACIVQNKLGIAGCPAFDVQAVCAGFMYAIATANAYIKSGMASRALIIGAEIFSRLLNWNDRRTCVLFGDGAGAVILGASEQEGGILHTELRADGAYNHILQTPGKIVAGAIEGSPYLYMDGQAVYKFAVKALASIAQEVIDKSGLTAADIDWIIPHQANLRIIESTARHLKVPMDKVIITLAEQGNTSAASIPLALDQGIKSTQIQRGQTLLLEGIGGGFAWGAVTLKY